MRLGLLIACVTACSLPKFRGANGGDDDHPFDDARGSGSDGGVPVDHDEDNDGTPDSEDPCPTNPAVAKNDPDADGDGVGDLCDPEPGISGDNGRLYTFVNGDTEDLEVEDMDGTLVAEPDAIEIGSVDVGRPRVLLYLPHTFNRAHVEVRYKILGLSTGDGLHNFEELSIHTGHQGVDATDGIGCSVEQFQFPPGKVYTEDGTGEHMNSPIAYDLNQTTGRFVVDHNATAYTCRTYVDGHSDLGVVDDYGSVPGQVGISEVQMKIRITALFVAGL